MRRSRVKSIIYKKDLDFIKHMSRKKYNFTDTKYDRSEPP